MAHPIINLAEEPDFELGALVVRPSASEIVRSGEPLRVEPRVMQVLVSLHRRRGETVGRDRLLDECWGGIAVGDDALVRGISQLRRLVAKGGDGLRIDTVPKVGYRLVVDPAETRRRGRRRSIALFTLGTVGASLALVIGVASRPGPVDVTPRSLSTPITSTPGVEQWPALSPSGGQVAFVRRENGEARDLYVQSIGSSSSLRLTHSSEDEYYPAWSPDGSRLAFARRGEPDCSIYSISPFGGAVARLASCGRGDILSLDWSSSGDRIAYTSREAPGAAGRAFLIDLNAGTKSALPAVENPTASLEEIAFAPGDASVAFTVSIALGVEDLYVYSFASRAVTRLTHDQLKIHGFDWLPRGEGFVVSSNRRGDFALWLVSRSGRVWTPLPGAVGGADEPRVSASGRLVYEAWRSSTEIWSALLNGEVEPSQLVPSTRYQWDARRSPDGRHMSFISDRSGSAELWIADADGGNPMPLTSFGGAYTHTPRYAPDGRSIAFATPAGGNFDLYLVEVATQQTRRLTSDPAEDFAPAWSPDGRSLYFGSTRSGAWQIWRLDLESERAVQVTRNGGRAAQASPDGRSLYFVKADRPGLFRLELGSPTDDEKKVLDDPAPVDWNNWHVLDEAVYYVRRPRSTPDQPEIVRHDRATGGSTLVRQEPRLLYKSGIWVADDESEILFSRVGVSEADLMLIESVGGS